jgi:hypothetical protein
MGRPWAWETNPQYLAQFGHVLGGALIVFGGAVLFHWEAWVAMVIVTILAGMKEFAWDVAHPPYGEGDSWVNSAVDWCFWVSGANAGWGLWAIADALHRVA